MITTDRETPTSSAEATTAGRRTLLLSLYPAPPRGEASFHRWPVPLKRLHIRSDEDLTAYVLELLREGGQGSYLHVEALIP